MCRAAVHNGADAIYVGYPGFNARGRTVDHDWESLADMVAFCRSHGVKVFLALNVLIFEKELPTLLDSLPKALALGADAFIVQDLGLARMLKFLCPEQVLHASTQMTVTNHEAIALTRDLDLARYVLGREVSVAEMAIIRAATEKELEVFVHGALCVAYSGQCLTSEGFGGRSANRGQCAQSCRMEYDLIVDDQVRDLQGGRHLVSPKDLCGLEDLPKLIELGIDSFKIEGRLKTPQYVAASAAAYSRAIHEQENGESHPNPSARDLARDELQITYSRGFFNGWLGGVDHQKLVDGRFGSHRGLEIGTVLRKTADGLRVDSGRDIIPGDGLLFVAYGGHESFWGGRVFSARRLGADEWELSFDNQFPTSAIPDGATIYLNDSPTLERRITRSYTDKSLWKTLPLGLTAHGKDGEPLNLVYTDRENRVEVLSQALLQAARNPATALTSDRLMLEAGALSGSGYALSSSDFQVDPGLFLSDREIRKMRQAAVATLQARRTLAKPRAQRTPEDALAWLAMQQGLTLDSAPGMDTPPTLNVLIRERDSLAHLEGLPIGTVYLDFEHGKDYKPAVAAVRAMGFQAGIATTRILKPSEYHNLKVICALRPDSVLVRNLGALHYLQGQGLRLCGDFSLNAANSLTARYLLDKGLESLCPAYDLNQWQLWDLLDGLGASGVSAPGAGGPGAGGPGAGAMEITVHQYLPSFHMEHCVFAAFLSTGSTYHDCGKPCESHRVELRDHTGARHPLKADQECRNTMFNGKPQSAARLVPGLLARGVRRFRLEALYEDRETLRTKILAYAGLLKGENDSDAVLDQMGVVEKYGVMEGQLRSTIQHVNRKKT